MRAFRGPFFCIPGAVLISDISECFLFLFFLCVYVLSEFLTPLMTLKWDIDSELVTVKC